MARVHYLPDGGYVTVPDNMSWEEADAKAMRQFPEAYGIAQKHGFFPAAWAAGRESVGAGIRGIGNLAGSEGMQQYGAQMMAPDQTPGAYHPVTDEESKAAWQKGILPGLGTAFERNVSEPVGGMVGRYAIPTAAGAAAALAAPEAGLFGLGAAGTAALVRGAGFIASDFPMEQGENVQRQQEVAQQAQAQGQSAPQFDQTNTIMASLAQAALMPVLGSLGPAGVKYFKLLGPNLAETATAVANGQMSTKAAIATLNSTAKNMLVRTGEAAAIGAPMMVGTEALRAAQAGEDLSSPEEQARLAENLKAAVAFAPLGGVMGAFARRPQVKAVEQAGAQFGKTWDEAQAEQAGRVAKEQAFQATPQGGTQDMGFGAPKTPVHPDLPREQAVLDYLKSQKAPKSDITAQRNVIKELQANPMQPAAPEEGAPPVAGRTFFNLAGIGNAGTGKKIREQFTGTPLDDPAKIEALQQALMDHANSKQAPTGDAMRRLTTTIDDLNITLLRSKFDEANKLYQTTGDEAPLRDILAKAKDQSAPVLQPELPLAEVPLAEVPKVAETVPVEKPVEAPKAVESAPEEAPKAVEPAPEKSVPEERAPEEAARPTKQAPESGTSREARYNKEVESQWEDMRDNSPDIPAFKELDPDVQDSLHAQIQSNKESPAVDARGRLRPEKVDLTPAMFKKAMKEHAAAGRRQEIQAELGQHDPDEFMYREGQAGGQISRKADVEQAAADLAGPEWNKNKLQVYETLNDVPAEERRHFQDTTTAVSFRGKKAVIVADRVTKGQEKAVILHEVGEHVGLDGLVGPANVVKLVAEVQRWKTGTAPLEREAALAAEKRIPADTPADLRGKELIAYTAEELHARGVTPRTNSLGGRFLSYIRDLAKDVMRRLGLGKELTGQDLVDVLHGAVAKELRAPGEEVTGKEPVMPSVKQAEEVPANEPTARETEEGPLGGSPEARKASVLDGVTSVAHDMADKYLGSRGHSVITDTSHVLKKLVGSLESLDAIVQRVQRHMPSAKTWRAGLSAKEATRGAIERKFEDVAQLANKLDTKRRLAVGDFLARSSLEQKWGHQPEGLGRTVTIDPKFAAEFKSFSPEEQQLIDLVFKTNEEIGQMQRDVLEKRGAQGVFAQRQMMEGPYVHLERKGDFFAELKSQAYLDAEKAKNRALVLKLKSDPTQYVLRGFDTPGQAHEFARANKGKFASVDAYAKSPQIEDRSTMSPRVLERVRAALGVDEHTPLEVRKAMEDSIRSLYLSTLDRNSAQQANRARLGTAGWDEDVISTMLNHGRARAAYIANVAHGAEINQAFHQMQNEIEHPETLHRVGQDDFNLIAAHHVDSLKYNPTPIQDGIVAATSAMQLATSLSYHLANFTQTVMVLLPKLAADFNDYPGGWRHVGVGYKQMMAITKDWGMTIDLTKIKDQNLRGALEHAANLQLLDVGMTEDLKHFDRFTTGYRPIDATSGLAARAIHKLRQVSSAVERWNRVSGATAAYNMAIEKKMSPMEAREYMVNILRETQGDFTHSAAPLLLKKLPKVVGQYKKFQLMMAAYYTKAFVGAFRGATANEREIGRRMLGFKLLHTGIASGVLGLPLMNLAGLVYGAVGGGSDDLESKGQKLIGDKNLAQLLLHGFPSFVGLDMSAKLGDDNIFSIAPYTQFDLTSKTGVAKTLAGMAGPGVGQAGRMAQGVGMIGQGDMYKGAEKLMPKGLEQAMQAFRLANDGYTLKNGDLVVKPEDISAFGILLTAAGLPSTEVKDLQDQEIRQYKITKFYNDKSRELEHQYVQAYKAKDQEKMNDLRAKWMELQKSKDDQRGQFKQLPDILKHQPLSTLISAPQRAQQREMKSRQQFNAS